MTRKFRLALAQINPIVGDIPGNARKIIEYVDRAREAQADLVAFPELAITGYPPEDLLFKPSFIQDNLAAMRRVVEASRGIAVVVGFVDLDSDIANAAALPSISSSSTVTLLPECPASNTISPTGETAAAMEKTRGSCRMVTAPLLSGLVPVQPWLVAPCG